MNGRDEQARLQRDASRIHVQVASQVSLTVHGNNIFRELQERVLKWGFDPKRNLKGIPDGAWQGETFEIDSDNSESAAAIRLDNPKYWAFRLRERLKDTSRIWNTEVAIAERSDTEVIFGCRLICSQRGAEEPIPRSVPAFVRGIAWAQDSYLDGRRLSPDPWVIDENSIDEFVAFLETPRRNHPVVAFSLPENSNNILETAVPVGPFIRRTAGYVHSAVITSAAAYALSERVGREFSVYRQAVRTYNPHLNVECDLPTDHPLATAARIADWSGEGFEKFTDFLVQQSLRLIRPRDVLEREQPPFIQVKRIAAERARASARTAGEGQEEILLLADEEVSAARQEAANSLDLAINAEAEREQALAEVRQIKASYIALQLRLDNILAQQTSDAPAMVIPENLTEIENWASANLSGQVYLHQRAIRAARDSGYQDTELLYNALLMMRDFYVPMKRKGGIELKNAFDRRLAELRLVNSACFAQENKAKKFGDTYYVRYQGAMRELDMHLKGSNSRDGRLGFRLYYFWDAETAQVVVGFLPGHLKTDIT